MKKAALLNNKLCLYFVPFVICIYMCMCVETISAQTATLSGTVLDNNRSVIPGVEITIINSKDRRVRSVKTSGSGVYFFASVIPGQYVVSAHCQGFTSLNNKLIQLNVGDYLSLDIILPIKSVTESLQVQGNATEQTREDGSASLVINRQLIEQLPLNGRSFQSLFSLSAGVFSTTPPYDECYTSVNGQRCNSNYFTVDGVSINVGVNPSINAGQMIAGTVGASNALGTTLVSPEDIEEFRLTTSSFAPEFGRTPGAQVSIITRSGTNEYHGSVFEYLRNDLFDANDWFNNARQLPRAALRQNNFGGVLGGYLKKDRSFFFVSYEGARLLLPQFQTSTVPSFNARQIAPERMKPFLNAFPLPTGKVLPSNLSEFNKADSNSSLLDAISIRLDHVISSRVTSFGRYSFSPSKKSMRGTINTEWPFSANTLLLNPIKTQTLTFGMTSLFDQNITNDLRLNWSNNKGSSEATLDNFGGAIPFDPALVFPSGINTQNGFFFMSLSSGINSRLGVGLLQRQVQRQLNFVDIASIQKNSHLFKIGADYRKLSPTIDLGNYNQSVIFAGVDGAVRGKVLVGFIDGSEGARYPICKNLSLFGQDNWKPTSKLSLTVGMRWELNPPPMEKYGKDQYALINIDDPTNLDLAPRGTSLYKTTFDNFAPRLGIAYAVSNISGRETILRGGFGKYYDTMFSPIAPGYGYGFPYSYAKPQIINEEFPFNSDIAERPQNIITRPYDIIPSAVDPNLKLPYSYHWNIALERSLGLTQFLSLSYVGSLGRRLMRQELINEPNPKFSQLYVTRNLGASDYNSLQVNFRRRMARNLQTLATYTWAHSIDNVSSDIDIGRSLRKIDLESERASSNFDIRHSVNIAMTYDLNLPKINRYLDPIIHNWSISSMFVARSAQPINIVTGQAPEGDRSGLSLVFRPDLSGKLIYIYDSTLPGGKRINPDAFVIPYDRQGMLGRNALRGFPMWQLDLALYRSHSINEKLKLRLGAEIFNVMNHPSFADPGTYSNHTGNILTSAQFGRSTAMLNRALSNVSISAPNQLYSLGGPRSIQFVLKLSF